MLTVQYSTVQYSMSNWYIYTLTVYKVRTSLTQYYTYVPIILWYYEFFYIFTLNKICKKMFSFPSPLWCEKLLFFSIRGCLVRDFFCAFCKHSRGEEFQREKYIISFIIVRMDKGLIWQWDPSFVIDSLYFENVLSILLNLEIIKNMWPEWSKQRFANLHFALKSNKRMGKCAIIKWRPILCFTDFFVAQHTWV